MVRSIELLFFFFIDIMLDEINVVEKYEGCREVFKYIFRCLYFLLNIFF